MLFRKWMKNKKLLHNLFTTHIIIASRLEKERSDTVWVSGSRSRLLNKNKTKYRLVIEPNRTKNAVSGPRLQKAKELGR